MNNLKKIRQEQNLSQPQLSELSGISTRSIQNYEQEHRSLQSAEVEVVYKLAKALNTKMEILIDKEILGKE